VNKKHEEEDTDLPPLTTEEILSEEKNNDNNSKLVYPKEILIIPITKRPFFPGMAAPILIEPGAYYDALKIIAKTDHKCMGIFLTKKENINIYKINISDLYKVGVIARILRIIPIETGGAQVVLSMERRISIKEDTSTKKLKYLSAKINYNNDPPNESLSKQLKAYSISIISTIKELLKLNPLFKEELQMFLGHSDFTEPGKLADFAVALTTATRTELQDVLACFSLSKRLDKALLLLRKELNLSQLQSTINKRIEATISKAQREFFLKEQLKVIKKELGLEKDNKTIDIEKLKNRLKNKQINKEVQKTIDEEFEKLSVLDMQSAEYGVCRNYLDWLTSMPWGIFNEEIKDLKKAEKILEKEHFGLTDIKERILEFISVGIISNGIKGSIICLVGPPGVGKTSVGKSIAHALNRKFYRFSVGGIKDEAEIKGHRRTYIGAMPGKMIQALKHTQSMNPVVMIDEVDKMGSSYQGDPSAALLEVLDMEQNKDFYDHYLDVPCDLSNILFIITANVLDTLPDALRDRMEILRLSGYIQFEKVEIAKRYLFPKNLKLMGLTNKQVSFTTQAYTQLINGYAREAGVRSLENNIKKILRKVTLNIVKKKEAKKHTIKKETITKNNLEIFLKKPIFTSDIYYKKLPVGVCTGLAWTALGGAILYVEAIKSKSDKTKMQLTGQAGDVMKESSQIAWSYLKSSFEKYSDKKEFFEKSQVHLHIPEGATPKDGPSAGITMVSTFLSLLINKPISSKIAMTGELTVTGKILPIGGLKEKITAAIRSNIKILIVPKDNIRDYEELDDFLKKDLKIYFVEYYNDVYKILWPKGKANVKDMGKRKSKKNIKAKRSK